ncbi:hypothetical protein V5799_013771 [Amblyomma americanum]|uniref:Secreted protein n=1 Tax=Amblyomma americanum TaxID=6943 RepID=A0AAQ4E4Z0_AMBAM
MAGRRGGREIVLHVSSLFFLSFSMHILSDCLLSDTRYSVVNFLAPEYFVLADNPGLALSPLARKEGKTHPFYQNST